MMGPLGFNQNFRPGRLVLINPSTAVHHDQRDELGTIIDNFVDFELDTGKRTERVLVMWPDSTTDWLHLYQVLLVPGFEESS